MDAGAQGIFPGISGRRMNRKEMTSNMKSITPLLLVAMLGACKTVWIKDTIGVPLAGIPAECQAAQLGIKRFPRRVTYRLHAKVDPSLCGLPSRKLEENMDAERNALKAQVKALEAQAEEMKKRLPPPPKSIQEIIRTSEEQRRAEVRKEIEEEMAQKKALESSSSSGKK